MHSSATSQADAGGVELRHRDLAHRVLAVGEAPGGRVGELLRGLGLGRHLGELVADRLELADRAAEGLALLGVLEGLLEHPLAARVAAGGGDQPLALELPGDVVEALALLAEQALGRDADVLEGELAGVGGVHPHLLQLGRDAEAGHLLAVLVAQVDDEQGDAVVALLRVGLGDEDDEVGARAVGDEGLGAVDHVLVAVADRGRADAGDVGAGAGLGDPEAADLLALDPGVEVALLLLLGAEQVDRGQDHVGLDREAHVGAARARVAHALGADQRVVVVAALAAVLLREAEAEEAELAGPLHRLGRPVGLLPLVAVGPELLLDPGLHRLAQVFVLLAEDEVLAARARGRA